MTLALPHRLILWNTVKAPRENIFVGWRDVPPIRREELPDKNGFVIQSDRLFYVCFEPSFPSS